ncbi:MAG: 50S ribosomal protein L11 methyltransferase [Muribaculaceae bacterium]
MNDYIEVRFDLTPSCEDATDLLAGLLADAGFESFVPDESGLTAYVKKELYDADAVGAAVADFPFDCRIDFHDKLVEGRDWNAEWEKNYFKPIVVGDRCVIHSSFHTDIPRAEYDIVIDPKMAFGTGHHSTTSLIIRQLLEADLKGRSVIDMGTGTGILAILAAMRGASPVTAIEIDAFAYENAVENVRLNGHAQIKVLNGDASLLEGIAPADVFIANINRNVITGDLDRYAPAVKAGGMMLLSGFYQGDDADIVSRAAAEQRFDTVGMSVDNNWCCLKLIKN